MVAVPMIGPLRRAVSGGTLIVALASSAGAAPWETRSKKATEQIDAAAVLFGAGEFAAAAAGYEAANRIAPSNKAVWNAAQSHAAAGDWPRALALLDQLLADPELPKEHLARVSARRKLAAAFVAAARLATEARFDEARTAYEAIAADTSVGPMDRAQASKALDALEVQRKAAQAEKPAAVPAPVDQAGATAEPPTIAKPPPAAPQRRTTDWLGWSLVGGGVLVGAAGGLAWWSAAGLYDDARAEPMQGTADDLFAKGDTRRIAGQVMIGVGAVALGVGITKLLLRSDDGASPAVTLTTFSSGGGLVVVGGF